MLGSIPVNVICLRTYKVEKESLISYKHICFYVSSLTFLSLIAFDIFQTEEGRRMEYGRVSQANGESPRL